MAQRKTAWTDRFSVAYNYSATHGSTSQKVVGMLYAKSRAEAIRKCKAMGLRRPVIRMNLSESIELGFGLTGSGGFGLRAKSRLFITLGKRLSNRGNLAEALETAAEYIDDAPLKAAIAMMRVQITQGEPVDEAMRLAGFSQREVMVVRALRDSGSLSKAFLDLGQDALSQHRREAALAKAMRMPKIMATVFALGVPAVFLGLGPRMLAFQKSLGPTMAKQDKGAVQVVWDMMAWADANTAVFLVTWTALVLVIALALRSKVVWEGFMARVPAFRDLHIKSDHAAIWSSYAVMFDARITPRQICLSLIPTTYLSDTAKSLQIMANRMAQGASDIEAIRDSRMPRFAVATYTSAKESGALAEGLESGVAMLNEDIELAVDRINGLFQTLALVSMSLILLAVFFVTYWPMASSILSQL